MNNLRSYSASHSNLIKAKKNAAVIGGGGFIGSHLSEALLVQGLHVYCIDDFSTIKKKNITLLEKQKEFDCLDIQDISEEHISALPKIHYYFYLSNTDNLTQGGVSSSSTLLISSQRTNIFLEKAIKEKGEFLFLSLADIYNGIASRLSLDHYFGNSGNEELLSLLYETKRFGEALVQEYHREKQLKARIIRVRDVYGPRMNLHDPYSVNELFNHFFSGSKIQIHGDGMEIVYPTYISDVVYGLIKSMFTLETEGKVYYLVNPEKCSLRTLAEKLLTYYSEGGEIEFTASDKIAFPQPEIDVALSRKELRWIPEISISEGLDRTIVWFKKESPLKRNEAVKEIKGSSTVVKKDFQYQETPIEKPNTPENTEDFYTEPTVTVSQTKEVLEEKASPEISEIVKNKLPEQKKEKPVIKKHFGRLKIGFIVVCLLFIVLGLLSPLVFTALFAYNGFSQLESAKKSLLSFDIQKSQDLSLKASKSFRTASYSLNNLLWVFSLIHERKRFQQYNNVLMAGKDLSDSLQSLSSGFTPLLSSLSLFLGQGETNSSIVQLTPEVNAYIVQASDKILEAESLLINLEESYFPMNIWEKVTSLQEKISENKTVLVQIEDLITILPAVMGVQADKAYLVIFQNNYEVRPTGGFIGSYARILVSQGKVSEIKVDDVYNPDGQITDSSIEVPDVLKEYLGISVMGMRDANWSPDFKTSAADIKAVYENATQDTISGVISIDLYTIKKLLQAMGTIEPVGYNEKITAENFFEKAEYYSEVNFTPGSTNKKDFLGACSEALLQKILSSREQELGALLQAIYESIDEKHILFSFTDTVLQSIATDREWSGEVVKGEGDYLLVVDSNVGGNKANYFVERSIDYAVTVDKDGNLESATTITYIHKQETNAWPGGLYRNYLRVYVPEGAVLKSNEGFSTEVKSSNSIGKTVFEGLVEVQVHTTQEVSLRYSLPKSLAITDTAMTYMLYLQKQSGSDREPVAISLSFPVYLQVNDVLRNDNYATGVLTNQLYTLSDFLQKDISLKLQFIK